MLYPVAGTRAGLLERGEQQDSASRVTQWTATARPAPCAAQIRSVSSG